MELINGKYHMTHPIDGYQYPEVYEAEYGKYKDDLPFFTSLIERGKVLDLAFGTGRLTIPLAQAGFAVVGLDASNPMLEMARKNSGSLAISYVLGNMTQFHLGIALI